jgi:hypothetical protein
MAGESTLSTHGFPVDEERSVAARTPGVAARWTDTAPAAARVCRPAGAGAAWSPRARAAGAGSGPAPLLAATPRWGGARRVAQGLAGLGRPAGGARPAGWGRNVRRRPGCPGAPRGAGVGKTTRGQGRQWGVVVDGPGMPVGNRVDSASPADGTWRAPPRELLAVPRHGPGRPRQTPARVIEETACAADPVRPRVAKRGSELRCRQRRHRVKPPRQEGRPRRRSKRRWPGERAVAWLGHVRRLVVRWERQMTMDQAFFHVACRLMTLRP